ncbi:conjugal transfer protein TraG [Pedobacter psychrophilus]|uniref:Conjugal transfer protein TraG n=1 Tax=Pedobacter psychrophilus TaxID=1826909 RepID=A0A179DLI7_9SPHI|nr:TraG family conjugative transposon ATPase [Pedobacter psychrophilus]OAQ41935.1 conjugal transfer protein TraG [Pedobacter psychrophilus]
MEYNLLKHFPIKGIEHDFILSKKGDFTAVFEVELPEAFTLSDDDYENIHQSWVKAIKILPKHSILHKQDWFLKEKYTEVTTVSNDFLKVASSKYFKDRPFLEHRSFLFLTKKPKGRGECTSLLSNLIKPNLVPKDCLDKKSLADFSDTINQFQSIVQDCKVVKLRRMKAVELSSSPNETGIIERYSFLNQQDDSRIFSDFQFGNTLRIGEKELKIYTLSDALELPHFCGSRMTYDKFSTDKTRFPVSFAGHLGLLLPCEHIYNQYLFVGDASSTLKKFEKKRLRLQSLSAYSRENSITRDATNDFLNEAISEQRLPVKAHFNIQIWSENQQELQVLNNQVTTAFSKIDASVKAETIGAPQLWWAGIPGNEADFPMNDTFDTFAEQASCFLNMETNYRSSSSKAGIRFCDRIASKPVNVDLFDEPRKKGLTSNMGMLVCGTSGGGKSMTVNHILSTLFRQGAHCVTVDIGGSYKGLCELVNGYYFTYTEENPIKFNPFYIGEGDQLDTEKKESLKSLLIALWKQENDSFNRSEYVALSEALQGFYNQQYENPALFPCFDSFYEYLKNDFSTLLISQKVKDKDFDLSNFLYVLRPYYKGGEFDYLLNARENLDLLNQPFIVIELDNIKDHPILFPVVTLIVMEMFISKMRKLGKTRKVLTIDEAWKAIAKSGMANFLKYAFKTIRKFNGIPIVITQELDDLVSSPIIKDAIINNADIKILMDMKKYLNKFDQLQEVLGLSEKGKAILLSVNKDNREIFIDLGGQEMKVYRNELCPEEYFAYTTEGAERVEVNEYALKFGSIEKGIINLVNDKQKEREVLR